MCLSIAGCYRVNTKVRVPVGMECCGLYWVPRVGTMVAVLPGEAYSFPSLLPQQTNFSIAQDLCTERLLWLFSSEQKPQIVEPLIYSAVQGPLNNSLYCSLFAQPPCIKGERIAGNDDAAMFTLACPAQWEIEDIKMHKMQARSSSTGLLWRSDTLLQVTKGQQSAFHREGAFSYFSGFHSSSFIWSKQQLGRQSSTGSQTALLIGINTNLGAKLRTPEIKTELLHWQCARNSSIPMCTSYWCVLSPSQF